LFVLHSHERLDSLTVVYALHHSKPLEGGLHVVIADRDNEAGQAAVEQVEQAGGQASHVAIDMSEEQQVRQLPEHLGRLGRQA
jgi:NAD(P)-dependent dehydrogenase (short-subunit alcohol dehydrogenase family)